MGKCKDCTYCYVRGMIFKEYICNNYAVRQYASRNHKIQSNDDVIIVSENGSCNYFQAAPTSESIGYHPGESSSGCFLTSACVEYLGKDDDCEELTILRRFRDTYMKNLPDGENLIEEYYAVAPQIIERINKSFQQDKYYDYIYQEIINCIAFIKNNDNESAFLEYTNMVNYLRIELGIA